MKKILIIGMTDILGGVETYIYNVLRYIDKSKFTFDFLVIGDKKPVYELEINKLLSDGKNHFFYVPDLKKHYGEAKQWLQEFYDSHFYDWIYMNTCTAARIAYCKYAVEEKHIKLITHSHNGSSSTGAGHIKNLLIKGYITSKSSVRLACSATAYRWMFTDEPKEESIVPNGIDTSRFSYSAVDRDEIRKQYGFSSDDFVIGHVGRFSKQKNQLFFIKLAINLDRHFKFLLIGDGDTKELVYQQIKKEFLDDRFVILDSKDDIERYYSAMDAFAMPSLYEGLPIVAIEAQSNGLQCVLSDKISEEANIAGHCLFASIGNISEWEKIFNRMRMGRYDERNRIMNCGYSINNTVSVIERILEN